MHISRFRLAVVLWIVGILGVAVMTVTVIPQFLGNVRAPVSHDVAIAASLVQSGVLLALSV